MAFKEKTKTAFYSALSEIDKPPRRGVMDERNMHYERIEVKCYSGYRINELPVSFAYKGREHLIEEIVDRWYEGGQRPGRPAMNYFKVRTTHGEEYILRYNGLFDAWALLIGGESDR